MSFAHADAAALSDSADAIRYAGDAGHDAFLAVVRSLLAVGCGVLVVVFRPRARLVEVKGPGDKLSDSQLVWIDVLLRAGADVEVTYVDKCV